ncbi:MAG TPA: tetratricopeptide repeat protein [Thermoanaerobaculia bacterium]|nr:tetratricopeptide repeat protein [Thermoanaerobaculia bacterium]
MHAVAGSRPQSTHHVLEQGKRLSESLLWRLQGKFFDTLGAQAWTEGIVPHYITGNVWIADAYAKVVLGWLRDCAGAGSRERASFPPLDLRYPVTLLELGCGSGRFGFLFFDRLLDLLGRSSLSQIPLRYVMTDFTESTLEPLRRHSTFQPWIEQGVLDFARYDASGDGEIRLEQSGEVLSPQTLRNPLVVLANYVFDGIPQDAFAVRGGQLQELLATLTVPDEETDLDDPTILQRVELTWEKRQAPAEPYGDPELDAILMEYAEGLTDTALLFPSAAIRCLRHLGRLADGRLLLLSGDKGYCHAGLLDRREEPALSIHGSFSMMANYHAVGRWLVRQSGEFLCSSHLNSGLNIIAGLLGTPPGGTVETRLAFDEAIERKGPDDFFELKVSFGLAWEDLSLEKILAWVRFSGWDANVLLACWPALMKRAATAGEVFRLEIYRAVHEVWNHYFPLPEASDLAFHLGVLLCEIDCHEEALPFFHESVAVYGPNPATVLNIGVCLFHLGQLGEAREQVEQALAAAPDFEPAMTLQKEIAAALKAARPRQRKRR